KTTPQTLIDQYRANGWWGDEKLCDWLDLAVSTRPRQWALIDQPERAIIAEGSPQRLTFEDLAEKVSALSCQFYAAGLRTNDIVIVHLPNIAELAITYFALDRLGVIVSPVPVQYDLFELKHVAGEVNPAAYISTSHLKGEAFAETRMPALEGVCPTLCFGQSVRNATSINLDDRGDHANWRAYTASLDRSADDILTICWTSGTTGQPKGVPRSHNHWRISALATSSAANFTAEDVMLNPFPLVNMAALGGFLFPWVMCQSTLVLHHPFDLSLFLKQLESEQITYTIAAPTILTMLLNQRDLLDQIDLSALRAIGSGGAPLSEWMVSTFQHDYNIIVANIFGSNEGLCLTSSGVDLPDPNERAQYFPRFGLEGRQWTNEVSSMVQTRLVDLETREVISDPGIEAELEISGPSVFDGYWQAEKTNLEVFSEDGFFRTGDVFEIPLDPDKSDYYHFVGRSKDIIIRGGMKISPDQIDNLLAAHPALTSAAVVGYEDPILGERIGVAAVPSMDTELTLEMITDYLKEQGLAIFKQPERLLIVDALPLNATGKVLRRELKQLFTSETSSS
ncbi:MAG: acyl--CoA ligase, partial [Gammaproteobacteria bacterium]|nr:acyl--CoA ligase [Gammaproteobacteria bacterium]